MIKLISLNLISTLNYIFLQVTQNPASTVPNDGFFRFLGVRLINMEDFLELAIRFGFTMIIIIVIVRYIYYKTTKRKDYLFTYIMISVAIFLLCFLLENVKLQLGFALGLFAIFGIIRYRTNPIPIREMTYLFVIIAISVMNALANKKVSYAELLFANAMIVLITLGLEKVWLLRHESQKVVIYEKIDLIVPAKRKELMQDLELRTGLKISRIEIGRIDFLKDVAKIRMYYFESDNQINLEDLDDCDTPDYST